MVQIPQERLILSNRCQFCDHALIEMERVPRCEVAPRIILQPAPQRVDRIERRGPGRQSLQAQPSGEVGRQLADRVPPGHRAPISDHHEAPLQFLQHRFEEGRHIPVVEVALRQRLEVQPQPLPPGREPQRRRDGDLLTRAALVQDRGLAPQCPGTADQRGHQQAALIDQGDVRPLTPGLLLMRGHWVRSHAAITSESRWRGTRRGFCGVKPRARSQALRYQGWSWMPNSWWISIARRGPVHRSVANPCSVGFSANQRRTIFSWVVVNLGGRPGAGRARRPGPPSWRYAATHRRTDRASTPRNSATSWVEYPSRTR